MIVYLIAFCILLYGSIHYDFSDNHYDVGNKWLKFEWVLLVLIAGLRYHIGGDSYGYESTYNYMPTFSQFTKDVFTDTRYNVLWYVFCASCKLINGEFYTLQIVHALIVNTSFVLFFKKNSPHYFTAILLYGIFFFFFYNTEILRAAIAVSTFLFAFEFLKNNKLIYYYLLSIICIGFHTEAVIVLLLPLARLIEKINMSIYNIVILVVVSVVVMTSINFIPIVSDYLSSYESISTVLDAGSRYAESHTWSLNGYIMKLFSYLPILIVLYYINKFEEYRTNKSLLILFYFFSIQSIIFPIVFNRSLDFLKPLYILCIADVLVYLYKMRKPILFAAILTIFTWTGLQEYMVDDGIGTRWNRYYPYSTILDPDDNPERKRFMDSITPY